MLAKTVKGFALVATRLQTKKGFGLFCRSWPDLSRVRTFGVVREGFALLGLTLPNIEKGSHFCADPGQNLERARTFGEGLQRVRTLGKARKGFALSGTALIIIRKGSHFWTFVPKGSRFRRTFAKGLEKLNTSN